MFRWWPRGRQGSDRTDSDPISREKERALKLFGEQSAEEPHPYAIDPTPAVSRPVYATAGYGDPRPAVSWRMPIMVFGILIGALMGLLLFVDDPKLLMVGPRKWLANVSGTTGYIDCAHVRLAGAAPLKKGDKGYSKRLDVDGDGLACESILSDGEQIDEDKAEPEPKAKRKRKAG
jgi:hypothetical protein